jgi:hypothetical protein
MASYGWVDRFNGEPVSNGINPQHTTKLEFEEFLAKSNARDKNEEDKIRRMRAIQLQRNDMHRDQQMTRKYAHDHAQFIRNRAEAVQRENMRNGHFRYEGFDGDGLAGCGPNDPSCIRHNGEDFGYGPYYDDDDEYENFSRFDGHYPGPLRQFHHSSSTNGYDNGLPPGTEYSPHMHKKLVDQVHRMAKQHSVPFRDRGHSHIHQQF